MVHKFFCENCTFLQTFYAKFVPFCRPNWPENHTLKGCTYPYSQLSGEPLLPPSPHRFCSWNWNLSHPQATFTRYRTNFRPVENLTGLLLTQNSFFAHQVKFQNFSVVSLSAHHRAPLWQLQNGVEQI